MVAFGCEIEPTCETIRKIHGEQDHRLWKKPRVGACITFLLPSRITEYQNCQGFL